MKLSIYSAGTLKHSYLEILANKHINKIKKKFEFRECVIKQEQVKNNSSDLEVEKALKKEAENFRAKLSKNAFVIVLDINGEKFDEYTISKLHNKLKHSHYDEFVFLIGSSNGLDENLKKSANLSLSFSKMTFNHRLAKIMLLEALTRL